MSRLLDFVYDVQLSFSVPVRRHAFVLRCLPDDGPGQRVLDLSRTMPAGRRSPATRCSGCLPPTPSRTRP